MKQQLAVVVGNAHTGRRTQNKKRQKRMQHDDPKTALLASLGGSVVCRKRKEAQKKRKNKKDKKAKKGCIKMRGQLAIVGGGLNTKGRVPLESRPTKRAKKGTFWGHVEC